MNICLIGTSNSIIANGYTLGIQETDGIKSLEKNSLGASPSVIIPYFASEIDFSRYDWLVMDTAINDRNYYIHKSINAKQIREFVEYGIFRALEKKCKPILLLMPSRKAFNRETISGIMYHKLAKEYKVPIFDGFEFTRKYAEKNNLKIADCFKDDFHLKPEVARALGNAVAELMLNFREEMPISPKKTIFRVCRLPELSKAFMTRRNSLITREFAVIDKHTNLEIAIGKNEEIYGLTYNCANTFGNIKINTEPPTIKSLTTKYIEERTNFLFIAVPFTTPPKNINEIAKIEISNLEPTESSRFESFTLKETHTPLLEIESLIIKRAV